MTAPAPSLRHHPVARAARRLSRRLGLWALGHFLEEAIESLWRSRVWSAFAVAIIGLSLATLGAFLLVAENLGGMVARLGSLEVSVYLEEEATPETIAAIRSALAARPGVRSLREVSRAEALELFRAMNPELARVPEALGENPFPASLEVTLAREARTRPELERFALELEAMAGVAEVSRDLELAERVLAASRLATIVASFLGGVLLLSALFTVSNIVKLTVYARREEVQLLRVVGATGAYVRGMFVTDGIVQGLSGSSLALLGLYASYRLTRAYLVASGPALLLSLTTRFLSPASMAILVVAGIALGAVGSLVPLSRLARS